jgi:hypothetical protein
MSQDNAGTDLQGYDDFDRVIQELEVLFPSGKS